MSLSSSPTAISSEFVLRTDGSNYPSWVQKLARVYRIHGVEHRVASALRMATPLADSVSLHSTRIDYEDRKTPAKRNIRIRGDTSTPASTPGVPTTNIPPTASNTFDTGAKSPSPSPSSVVVTSSHPTHSHRTDAKEEKNLAKAVDITIDSLSRPLREQYHGALTNNPELTLATIITRFESMYKNGRLKYDEQWENLTWKSDDNFDTFVTKFYTLESYNT